MRDRLERTGRERLSYRRIFFAAGMVLIFTVACLVQIHIAAKRYENDLRESDEKQLRLAKQALTAEFYNNAEIVRSLGTYQEIRPFFLQSAPAKGSKLVQELNAHFTNNNIVDDIFMHFFCDEYFYSTKTGFSTRSFMELFHLSYGEGQLGDQFLEQMQEAQQPFFLRDVVLRQSASQELQDKYILYVYPYKVDNSMQGSVIFQINEANLNAWIGNAAKRDIYIFDAECRLLNCPEISGDILENLSLNWVQERMEKTVAGEAEAVSRDRYYIMNGSLPNTGLYYICFAEHSKLLSSMLRFLGGGYLLLLFLPLAFWVMVQKELLHYKKETMQKDWQIFQYRLVGRSDYNETDVRELGKIYGIPLYANWHFAAVGQKKFQEKAAVQKIFFDETRFPYFFRIPLEEDFNVWIIGASRYMANRDLKELCRDEPLTVGNMYAGISGIHSSYIEARSYWDVALEPQAYNRALQSSLDGCYQILLEQAGEAFEREDPLEFAASVKEIRCKCEEQNLPTIVQCRILEELICLMQKKLGVPSEENLQTEGLKKMDWDAHLETLTELMEEQLEIWRQMKKQPDKPKAPPLTIEAVLEEIEKNYCDENFSLQMLADYFGLSLSYLSLFFKEKHGDNLLNYYTELRMEKAKELLMTTELSLKQIAATVGYSNVSSFIRRFKQLYGVTPGSYKKGQEQPEEM